jgi:hypothetical protein
MPTSSPTTQRSHLIPRMTIQDGAIDAPDGEELIPVTVVAFIGPTGGKLRQDLI